MTPPAKTPPAKTPPAKAASRKADALTRLATAALRLLARKGLREFTPEALAKSARLPLAQVRAACPDRVGAVELVFAWLDARAGDHAHAAGFADPPEASDPTAARDRLFDLLMARLEALAPYKAGVRAMRLWVVRKPLVWGRLAAAQARSARRVLACAGLTPRPSRVAAVAAAEVGAQATWLQDEDEGMARTMARLDSLLRRGEEFAGLRARAWRAARDTMRGGSDGA